jgi:MFS family permease
VTTTQIPVTAKIKPKLTGNQIRSFWAAWGGWSMDGMDSFIYSLVLVPALTELLPRSGIPATTANVGYYGGIFFTLFLIGYGTALVWGPIADRFGRVRTMMFSIFCFSLFTLLAAFATGIWSLAVFRFMAGVGIGGEWSIGAALVSEDWPEERRTMGAALMHTGYYIGFFLAGIANIFIGSHYGWSDVCAGRRARAADRPHSQQRAGARALGKQGAGTGREVGDAQRVSETFFSAIPPPDDRQ